MIYATRVTTGKPIGLNSRRVLYVDFRPALQFGKQPKGSLITMNNGDKVEVQERPDEIIHAVSKDRKKG